MSENQEQGPGPADRFLGVGLFVGGIVIGMAVIATIWLIHIGAANRSTDVKDTSPFPTPVSGSATTGQRDVGVGTVDHAADTARQAPAATLPTALDRCTTASQRLEGPLDRARAAIGQWAVHVGAMNKLVVGALTLPQAKAFWNQTRVAAYQRIDDFHQAGQELRRTGVDCPTPAMLGTTSSPELRACSRHVAAEAEELDAARRAITTWAHHVRAMDMLRMGRLSPTRATQMWLAMWQRGQDEIARYTRAARTTRDTPGCDGSVAPPPSGARAHGGSASGSSAPAQSPMPSMSSMN